MVKRPGLITLLAVLHFIGASLLLILGSQELWDFPFGSLSGPPVMFEKEAGVLALVFAAAAFACGTGLWRLKPYGRRIQIGLAVIWVFLFPVGTVIGAVVLFYMWTPGIRALYSGTRAETLTPAERSQIASAAGPGGRAVAIGTAVALAAAALIGTIYFVTKPARVKARIAANEAAAIDSMRAIMRAQESYAAAGQGGYATSLEWLAIPCEGMSQGFLSSDLAKDSVRKSGYIFSLVTEGVSEGPSDCNGARTVTNFVAKAEPINFETGKRTFFASADGVLHERVDGTLRPVTSR